MTSPGEEPIVQVRTVEDLMEMAHGYQRSMVLFAAMDLGVFSALAGGPSDAASLARRLCADPRRLAILLNALRGGGRPGEGGRAAFVGARIPWRKGERVLDLGGGPGTYAVEWAKRYPGARLTVFDTPETLAVTRKILKEKGASRLVALREGDFMRDRLGGPFDFIWISQILHAYSEKEC